MFLEPRPDQQATDLTPAGTVDWKPWSTNGKIQEDPRSDIEVHQSQDQGNVATERALATLPLYLCLPQGAIAADNGPDRDPGLGQCPRTQCSSARERLGPLILTSTHSGKKRKTNPPVSRERLQAALDLMIEACLDYDARMGRDSETVTKQKGTDLHNGGVSGTVYRTSRWV